MIALNQMGNRGQTVMLAILFAAMFFLLGIVIVNFIQPDVRDAQVSLDCNSASVISDGTKIACLITDGVVPYFIILIVSTAGGIVTSKLLV